MSHANAPHLQSPSRSVYVYPFLAEFFQLVGDFVVKHGCAMYPSVFVLQSRRWTRVLLLQQMLIDAQDLLDPTYVRVPKGRRTRLMPIEYGPLPALSEYQRKLRVSLVLQPFE